MELIAYMTIHVPDQLVIKLDTSQMRMHIHPLIYSMWTLGCFL